MLHAGLSGRLLGRKRLHWYDRRRIAETGGVSVDVLPMLADGRITGAVLPEKLKY